MGARGPFGPLFPQALLLLFPALWSVAPGGGPERPEQAPRVTNRVLLGNSMDGVGQGHGMPQSKTTGRLLHQRWRWAEPSLCWSAYHLGGGAPPMLKTVQLFKVESLLENQDSPASSSWPESPLAPKPSWGQGPLRGGGCRR